MRCPVFRLTSLLPVVVSAGLVMVLFQSLNASKDRDWKMGKVADSATSRDAYTSGATTTASTNGTISPDGGGGSTLNANTTAVTRVRRVEVHRNDLVIVGDDYLYTVEDSPQHGGGLIRQSLANRKHGCRFILHASFASNTRRTWREARTRFRAENRAPDN